MNLFRRAQGDLCALLMMVLRHCKWYGLLENANPWVLFGTGSGTDKVVGQQLGRLIVMVHRDSPSFHRVILDSEGTLMPALGGSWVVYLGPC